MSETIAIDEAAARILRDALKLDEFFPDMRPEDIAAFFPQSGLCRYAAREYVLTQGEAGRDVFVVVEGSVTVTRMGEGSGSKLGALGPGELLGEIALALNGTRTATAIATNGAVLFRLAYPDVESLLIGNPPLGEHLKGLAQRRLRED